MYENKDILIKILDNNKNFLKIHFLNKEFIIFKNSNKNNIKISICNSEKNQNIKIIKSNSDFYKIIKKEYAFDNNFIIKHHAKLVPNNNNDLFLIKSNYNDIDNSDLTKNYFIQILPVLKGGNVIDDITNGLKSVVEFFEIILKGVLFLIKITVWVIRFILWIIIEFLNPVKIFTDMFGSVMRITKLIIVAALDLIMGILKFLLNKIFGYFLDGSLLGWDQSTYDEEKNKRLKETARRMKELDSFGDKSNFSDTLIEKEKDCREGDKCYETPPGQIPFSIVIMSILCPPLGIFMQYGITYWLNIVLCCLLTMIYYVPGLLYSLILLYC